MGNEVHQVDGPQGFAVICAGDPNGAVRAPKGTVAYDNITPAIWQNTNGVTTWIVVGSGGGGGFPLTKDDGTYTYTVDASAGNLTDTVTDDATGTYVGVAGSNVVAGTQAAGILQANSPTKTASIAAVAVEATGGIVEITTGASSADLIAGTGDPNTVVTAREGSLFLQVDGPAVWQNTNGVTAWTKVASTFPVGPFDTGTAVAEITAAAGTSEWSNVADSDGSASSISLAVGTNVADSNRTMAAASGASITETSATAGIANTASWQLGVSNNGGTHVATFQANSSASTASAVVTAPEINLASAKILVGSLPTSDPAVSGQLYTVAGVLHVSP